MAGRVYLSAIAALMLVTVHVNAFYLPPMPFLPNMLAPIVHPAALMHGVPFLPFMGLKKGQAPRAKPPSRPFTLADVPGNNFPLENGLGGVVGGGGMFVESDPLMGGDLGGLMGGGLVGGGLMGGLGGGIGLAAATNDLNSVGLTGAMDPLDAGGLEISDSTVSVNGAGSGYRSGRFSSDVATDLTDSSTMLLQNGGTVGTYPAGTFVQTI